LGTALRNQNTIQEEIKSRLKSGNACYHSVQNRLSSSLLSKNFKICRTIIFPVVLYECETWSLTLLLKEYKHTRKSCGLHNTCMLLQNSYTLSGTLNLWYPAGTYLANSEIKMPLH
jgi:hypothetical protein